MSESLSRRRLRAAAWIAVLMAFASAWIALDLTEDRPRWLTVEAPGSARVGQPFEIRVTLSEPVAGVQIDCTLHRANRSKRGWGYLASAGPPRPAENRRTYSYLFTVPEREDTAFVFAIVYLSPTGKWRDAARAASTTYIPLAGTISAATGGGLRKTGIRHFATPSEQKRPEARMGTDEPRGRPSAWVHGILGLVLLAAAVTAGANARRSQTAPLPAAIGDRTVWLVFAVVLAASAVVEISGVAGHLAAWGRTVAREQGVYEFRRPAQKAIMAAVAAASLGLFFLFVRAVRKTGSPRFMWWAGIGLAGYLAVSFISVLSFHAVDVARHLLWHGLSPVDAARGAGAAVALLAAVFALRRKTDRRPI